MDSALACYAAAPGSIPAMFKSFFSSLVLCGRINKMEPDSLCLPILALLLQMEK